MDNEKLLLMQRWKHRTREMFHGNKCSRIKEDKTRYGSKIANKNFKVASYSFVEYFIQYIHFTWHKGNLDL